MCNCKQSVVTHSNQDGLQRKGTVKVKLVGAPVVINGSVTGRMYIFRNVNDINWVDRRDALEMKDNDSLVIL